jgi:hypothetical protein
MRPTSRTGETYGQRLARLRGKLELSQAQVAKLSDGRLYRTDVVHAEDDGIKWRGDRYWTGFGRAFGLDRNQLERFLEGTMEINEAFVIAYPRAKLLLDQDRIRAECDGLAREAMSQAGINQEEFAPETLGLLQRIAREAGPTVSRAFLAEEAKRILVTLVTAHSDSKTRAERASRSHKK